jgi:tetratricopeptide (TPR) repeat protein
LNDAVIGLDRIARAHSGNSQYLRDLSWGCNEKGKLQLRVGAMPEALALFERGRVAIEAAAKINPERILLKRDQMWSYMKLGDYYQEAGNKADASDVRQLRERELYWFQQAENVAGSMPKNALQEAESEIGAMLDRLFDAYSELNRHDEALVCAARVLKLRQESLHRSPDNKLARSHLGVALDKMGIAELNRQKPQDALTWFTKSMELSQQLLRDDPGNLEFEYDLARSYMMLAEPIVNGVLPIARSLRTSGISGSSANRRQPPRATPICGTICFKQENLKATCC